MRVIVELGRVLGLIVAAEGVETEGQLTLLRELGVDIAQGNLMPPQRAHESHLLPEMPADCRSLYSGPEPPSAGSGGRPAVIPHSPERDDDRQPSPSPTRRPARGRDRPGSRELARHASWIRRWSG